MNENHQSSAADPHQGHVLGETPIYDDDTGVLDWVITLAKHKKLLIGVPFVAALVAAGISMVLTPHYTATTKLLTPQQPQSTAAAMLGQLGGLAGGAGIALGIKSPADLYVGMLKSRSVLDRLVERFDLETVYGQRLASDTRKKLESLTKIVAGKDGIITVDVEDEDPKRAAALANGYVEELTKLTSVLAVTEAGQRRLFFERQLQEARLKLRDAELAAASALEKGGLAAVDARGRAIIETSAAVRARMAAKEIEIAAMRGFASEGNPDLQRAQQEHAALRQQLTTLEGEGDGKASLKASVSSGLKNVGLLRDVKYHEFLFELLAKQYEMARIEEARDGMIIQVLDPAVEPDHRSSPRRTMIVLITVICSALLALIAAFIKDALEKSAADPKGAEQLARLRRELRWKSERVA